jgi:hypothetical protein
MRAHPASWLLASLAVTLLSPAPACAAPDPCEGFSWDVRQERALFAQHPEALTGARNAGAAPLVQADHLYQVALAGQSEVSFAVAPGRPATGEAYAGILRLKVPTAGTWRVSLDSKLWVDVLADGAALTAGDFQGRAGCSAPHKIVEFVLPAGKELTLQLSAAATASVRLGITRAPARAPQSQ